MSTDTRTLPCPHCAAEDGCPVTIHWDAASWDVELDRRTCPACGAAFTATDYARLVDRIAHDHADR